MIASQILHADLLDIIFENRNKAYGAYALRKIYDQQIAKALGFVFFLMAAFTFIVLNTKHSVLLPTRIIEDNVPTKIMDEVGVLKPKENREPAKTGKNMSSNFVFVDSLQLDSIPIEDNLLVAIGTGDAIDAPDLPGIPGGSGGAVADIAPPTPPAPVVPIIDVNTPIEKADIDPSYPGGLKALTKFLERNLENPEEVGEGESVSVKVKFVVGFDGELKTFEVKEDGGEAFNKEVIRVLKKMPRWIPGKANGQNVSVYFTIPVKFINGQ